MSNFKIVKLIDPIQLNLAGGLNFQGDYDNATAYVVGDVVTYNGSSYAALQNTTGNLPTDTNNWQLLAEKGDPLTVNAGENIDIDVISPTEITINTVEDDDAALTANSATVIPSQKAVKAYADTKLAKATNVTSVNDTGIADGEIVVFNLTNKDIRTSDKTIVTTIGSDDTTVPTSKAVKDATVASNIAITGATKTKITYDAKGLVTAGADAGTSDITGLDTALDGKVAKAGDTMTGNLNMGTNNLIGGTGVTSVLKLQGTTANGTATAQAINLLVGNNGATTAMTVLNNGNVGIGTGSPSQKLEVVGGILAISNSNASIFSTRVGGASVRFEGGGAAGYLRTSTNHPIYIGTNNIDRLTIDTDGKIGINTYSPNSQLQVNVSTASTVGQIIRGAASQTADLLQIQNSTGTSLVKVTASGVLEVSSSDALINGLTVGRGGSNIATNTASGSLSLLANTTGSNNTAQGSQALRSNTTGSFNTAQGFYALRFNTTGSYNTAMGNQSLYSNTTGGSNMAIGHASLLSNTTGSINTAIGQATLFSLNSGSNNIAIGSTAGRYFGSGTSALTTANNSLFLGVDTRASADDVTNEIVIGASAIGNGSNTVTLGNTSITKTILQGSVGIGTTSPAEKLDVSGTVKATGYKSSDGSAGVSGTFTTTDGKTITIKDGLVTSIV